MEAATKITQPAAAARVPTFVQAGVTGILAKIQGCSRAQVAGEVSVDPVGTALLVPVPLALATPAPEPATAITPTPATTLTTTAKQIANSRTRHGANTLSFIDSHRDRIAYLTVTMPDGLNDAEAETRFNSFSKILRRYFPDAIWCREYTRAGALHFHAVVIAAYDFTGVDADAVRAKDYRTVPRRLRALWRVLRRAATAYSVGAVHVLPMLRESEDLATYHLSAAGSTAVVARNVRAKGVEHRRADDATHLGVAAASDLRALGGAGYWPARQEQPRDCGTSRQCQEHANLGHAAVLDLGPRPGATNDLRERHAQRVRA